MLHLRLFGEDYNHNKHLLVPSRQLHTCLKLTIKMVRLYFSKTFGAGTSWTTFSLFDKILLLWWHTEKYNFGGSWDKYKSLFKIFRPLSNFSSSEKALSHWYFSKRLLIFFKTKVLIYSYFQLMGNDEIILPAKTFTLERRDFKVSLFSY